MTETLNSFANVEGWAIPVVKVENGPKSYCRIIGDPEIRDQV
jgi:hypothetical protein